MMKIGVKFCGGCNPHYERGEALARIKASLAEEAELIIAAEDITFDGLLVLGGCQNCCASHTQFHTTTSPVLMWDIAQEDEVIKKIKNNLV